MRSVLLAVLLLACGHHHDGVTGDGGDGTGDGGGSGGGDGGGGNGDSGTGGDGGVPATGGLDPGFGSGGTVVVSGTGIEHAYDLAIQSDGKIVVAGDTSAGMLVLRFRDDGSLDPTFGTQGRAVFGGAYAKAYGVALQADGKIVVGGTNDLGPVVARLDSTGALDPSFGTAGITNELWHVGAVVVNDVAIRADGTILACGEGEPTTGSIHFGYVARLTTSGAIDTTFGTGGASTLTAQRGGWFARMAIDSQDRIVATGTIYFQFASGNGEQVLLGRFTSTGALDGTFLNGEQAVGAVDTFGRDIVVLPDGRALLAGLTATDDAEHADAFGYRTTTDGNFDVGFGMNGETKLSVPGMWASDGFGLAIQSDGAGIFVAQGDPTSPGPLTQPVAVARLTTTGASDMAFGTQGSVVFTVTGGDANPRATAIAANGKIYVVGFTSMAGTNNAAIFLSRVR
jgi:uncharacterized delta-60 repeat protein